MKLAPQVDKVKRHDLVKVVQIQMVFILRPLKAIDQRALMDVQRFGGFGKIEMCVTPAGDHLEQLFPIVFFADF